MCGDEMNQQVWIECESCGGLGLDPDVDDPEEDRYMYYCVECEGSGGWWQDMEHEST
jgi:hypothetical protein